MPGVAFDHIGMTFPDGTEAIDDVSLVVDSGEFVTVVGPSGCGKSTLLRIASGLLAPTAGTVTVDRDHLGYVFQDATLLPWRTVRQNVELLAELRGVDKAERGRQAQAAIEMVGLGGFEQHYPIALSGGMKMRASLARTLSLKPPVFLFDEPFAAVDEITRERLNEQTLDLFEDERFAGLFITHSIGEAVYMSTRVLVMSRRPGRIVAEFDVPFGYPRPPELRFDAAFATLSGEISKALRGSVGVTELDETIDDPLAAAVSVGFRAPSAKREKWTAVVLPPLVLGVVVIGIWYVISYGVLAPRRRFLLRPPHAVLTQGFLDWDSFSEILDGLWSSAKVAIIGLAISIVLGIAIAMLMSQTKLIERAVFPFAVMLQAIPILAITPLIGFWFGYGMNARVIVCVIISIFPIMLNTLFGLQSADRGMHDLFTLEHVSRVTRLRKLMFPAALPAIFAGMRISAGLSVIGAIVGDFFFGQGETGIGQLLRKYANNLDGEELFTAVIMSSMLGVVVFLGFGLLQQRVIGKWSQEAR